uniref:Ig-like domain-containing protein n=1 Tax=Prolemur simus TaxID=1328070 RepID=A0A8C8YTL4_PROSS
MCLNSASCPHRTPGHSLPMDTGITQTPRHLVMGMTEKKSLKCEQNLGHNAMYWYKQSAKKPLELMFVFNYKKLAENLTMSSRFSPEFQDNSYFYLHLDTLQPEDSATYLCASSQDTALQSHRLPVHKPSGPARKLWEQPRAWLSISCENPARSFGTQYHLLIQPMRQLRLYAHV